MVLVTKKLESRQDSATSTSYQCFSGNKYLLHACTILESTLCRLHHGINIILFPLCNFLHVLVNHIDEMLSVGVLLALHGHMNETNLCHGPCVMCLALIIG